VIELFQITGSCSFAARAALEEIGCDYTTVDIHPRRRDEIPDFAAVNPLKRVPSLREGPVKVYETGAVLAYLGDRFPAAGVAPQATDPDRGAYLRWLFWLADTLHGAWWPVAKQVEGADDQMRAHEAFVERELGAGDYCLGDRFSLADIYLYMLVGWRSFYGEGLLRGATVQAHFERVGARPAIVRTRELDDLDPNFQRYHPELRAGQPV
jgi:glutathione S-transferase